MFIGRGSAGTAGGIKVTTFGLLAFVIWSEMRGEPKVNNVGHRRVPETNQRQALAVALLGIGTVAVSVFLLLAMTRHSLELVLLEVVSAFATVCPMAGAVAVVLLGDAAWGVMSFAGLGYSLTIADREARSAPTGHEMW